MANEDDPSGTNTGPKTNNEEKEEQRRRLFSDYDDPLYLQSSDNTAMMLVPNIMNGNNFLTWRISIRNALGAKNKLVIVDGLYTAPEEDSEEYKRWIRVNCMLISWILNSISKEIGESFLYVTSARQLWLEIEERYGESSGPMIYQIQREIGGLRQGNLTVTQYFNNLKKLWDELNCLMPNPTCVCGAAKVVAENNASNQLVQFLMGLSEGYEQNIDQILLEIK